MSDPSLREAYARAVKRRADPTRASCPAADALEALARGEGPESERIALLDHVLACTRCREDFELLRAIAEAGGVRARAATRTPAWRYVAMAVAASLLLAIGIGSARRYFVAGTAVDDDVLRDGAGISLVVPQDDATVPRSVPLTLTWQRQPAVERYAYEVLTAEGAVAITGLTSDTAITLPAERLPEAGDYVWLVRAVAPVGVESRSVARRLRLTR